MKPNNQRLRHRYAAAVEMNLHDDALALGTVLGITPDEVESHFLVRTHAGDTWRPDDFEPFGSLPPGRFDQRVFEQTTWWVDVLRRPHRIGDPSDFSDDYLCSVIRFIEREAWRWADFSELQDDDLVDMDWFRHESVARIEQTPLMRALRAELLRRST